MRGVHTVEEVRAAEAAALTDSSGADLMLRAAAGLAVTCAELLTGHAGGVYGRKVVLLVGVGNNGGDALYCGARLADRGAQVSIVPVGAAMHLAGAEEATRRGARVVEVSDAGPQIAAADLVVDGMLGIGGKGDLREPARALAGLATDSDALVVAVDLPSGVDADTGTADDTAVWADVTVTFGLMKAGLLLQPGAMHAGLVELVDIGLVAHAVVPSISCLDNDDVAGMLPHPAPLDHKYRLGVAGMVAGSSAYPGAAVLAVGGASNTKPGLVRYVGEAAEHVVAAWPSAIVSRGSVRDAGRVQAWGVGPGLGLSDDAVRAVTEVLAEPVPVVVDADGLTLVARDVDLVRQRSPETVLTPHATEFARIAPDLDPGRDAVTAARTLAARLGCTVLLKGATTVVAAADGQVRLNLTGTPWLATGGTGDVLTGVVTALLSSGLGGFDAASVGAYLHGVAGRIAADGAATTADAVARALPDALRVVQRPQPADPCRGGCPR
jgi:hydroxyethylthiazole kinase-like uncharacterized protein yjeF